MSPHDIYYHGRGAVSRAVTRPRWLAVATIRGIREEGLEEGLEKGLRAEPLETFDEKLGSLVGAQEQA
jgi:hypothetical protein